MTHQPHKPSPLLQGPTGDALRDFGLLVLRVVPAVSMVGLHGYPKLAAFSEKAGAFPDPIGLGPEISLGLTVFAECLCAALVGLGLFTRLAAVPLCVTMFVAAFVVHGADPWAKRELALLYLAVFGSILMTGPGRLSVDAVLGRKAAEPAPSGARGADRSAA